MKTEHIQTQQSKGGRLYILYIKSDNFDDIESLVDKKDYSMFVPIIDNNIYVDCERCEVIENIKSLCDFIVRSAPIRITFKEGYELYNKCTEEVEKLRKNLKPDNKQSN